jgi:hypothetical protein
VKKPRLDDFPIVDPDLWRIRYFHLKFLHVVVSEVLDR